MAKLLNKVLDAHLIDTIRAKSGSHLRSEIHLVVHFLVATVGQPAETIEDLSVPRCLIFPTYFLNVLDRVEGEVDPQLLLVLLRGVERQGQVELVLVEACTSRVDSLSSWL